MQLASSEPDIIVAGSDLEHFYRVAYTDVARALGITLGDRALGAEAADEVMARTFAHWEKVRHYDNPGGWAYRVGLNWARSLRRRIARRPVITDAGVTEQPAVADPQIQQALEALDWQVERLDGGEYGTYIEGVAVGADAIFANAGSWRKDGAVDFIARPQG